LIHGVETKRRSKSLEPKAGGAIQADKEGKVWGHIKLRSGVA